MPWRRTLLLFLLAIAGVILFGLCVPFLWKSAPYSDVWCLDVMAGRSRHQEAIFGVTVVDRVIETDLTRMYRELVGEPPPPVWYSATGEGRVLKGLSERWDADAGYLQKPLLMAEWLQKNGLFTREAKKAVILKFFALLHGPDVGAASVYAGKVFRLSLDWEKAKKTGIDVKDLPTGPFQGSEAPPAEAQTTFADRTTTMLGNAGDTPIAPTVESGRPVGE